ncbi:MAG: UvrD-helicase domain-containing protein, partial [Chitinispirillales bacterium]|nr:UvrD-helicase domain-containing protein [Chitinispirillales bacterium]
MMNNSRIISNAGDIDLSRHGIIEAHAGTGKTYTIVKMVLRMLELPSGSAIDGKFIHLKEILLVTYTEKAAGELKKRIQDGIAERVTEIRSDAKNNLLTNHLENCLNNMHEALIGTIHSVCLRLLQTWPFETGVHFNTRMVNDEEGAEALLRESMRTDWQNEATYLPQALSVLERLGVKLADKKHLLLIRKTALELLRGDRAADTSMSGRTPIDKLIDKIDTSDPSEDLPDLQSKLLYALIHRAAEALAARYGIYKREKGLVSFDDMLRLMYDAVHAKESVVLKTLREKLRYGIIDEFQDTSVIQWKIFNKIFLDTEAAAPQATKIYVVGDPKQSIYSFQNADIQSYIAAKNTIAGLGGAAYSLIDNYRSLPEMIDGYNAILGGREDWFLFGNEENGGISYPSNGKGGRARAPVRKNPPRYPLNRKAVQIVPVNGSEPECRQAMAAAACAAIKKLRGTTVSIPDGPNWKELTLDYSDFAVIVESHAAAKPFIDEFREHRIPFMKYKLHGVFESPLARDLLAVLTAIRKRDSKAPRTAALLTHFFNKPPETIDPEKVFEFCPDRYCSGDTLCIAHALDSWGKLADWQLWAQLFRSIVEKTEVQQRLIRLADGERKLADLRQVADYCIEYLYQQNSNLKQLTDHLERLYKSEEKAGDDKNIHTLSTEKSSVKILTMHASKGLEFPVVFLMNNKAETQLKGPDILPWTDSGGKRRFTPLLSISKADQNISEQFNSGKENQKRERRRLLYVAMTRPQAMLFVPMREKESELSPRLKEILNADNPTATIFDETSFDGGSPQPAQQSAGETQPSQFDDIPKLSLQEFICRETSYTQLSRELKEHGRDLYNEIETGDEDYGEESTAENISSPQTLPGGAATGNALHGALEEILCAEHINAIINDDTRLGNIVKKHLKLGGILDNPSTQDPNAAVKQAAAYIKTALTAP